MGFPTRAHDRFRSDNRRGAIVPFLVLAAAAVVVAVLGPGAFAALAFDRPAIAAGEPWRLLTAHVVHLGPGHLVLNLAGLALIGWLIGRDFRWPAWTAIGLTSAFSVTGSLYLFHPEVAWYVGLSGLLHGLLAGGLMPGVIGRRPESLVLMALLIGKLAWEAAAGPLPGSTEAAGGPVLVEAHRYGAAGGMIAGVLIAVWDARARSV